MMHVKGISSSNINFTKRCCDDKKQNDARVVLATIANDSFEKQVPKDVQLLKEQAKNELATRIIAFQQKMIEDLKGQLRA